MAGLSHITRDIRASCPNCRASLDLSEFGGEIFRQILAKLKAGDRVVVSNFGVFTAKYLRARVIKAVEGANRGVERKIPGRMSIRFKASEAAKREINDV